MEMISVLAAVALAGSAHPDGASLALRSKGNAAQQFIHRRMIFANAARGASGVGESWYRPAGYYTDNYRALKELLTSDGFSAVVFDINETGDRAGIVSWPTAIPAFDTHPLGDIERTLEAAEAAGLAVGVSVFTGGLANAVVARDHPEWRQLDQFGGFRSYMGPLICWNTPYWEQHLLPLYREFFRRYGNRLQALILWEGPDGTCFGAGCQAAFANSGVAERADWEYRDRLDKWRELVDAIRADGWDGTIIGGGWGGYEWEQERWDGTAYEREHYRALAERPAVRSAIINAIMPELYIHDLYGSHFVRREDAHYVYRSLIYERSVVGPAIIPAVELHWRRSMLPHELLRWLLECWSAGFQGVAVVSESKLYFEHHHETQERFRGLYREIFRQTARLPAPGSPRPNFVLVVSDALERALDSHTIAMVRDWEPRWVVDGRTARATTVPDKAALILYIPNGRDCRLALDVRTVFPSEWAVYGDLFDGGSWQDIHLGDFSLPEADSWGSVVISIRNNALLTARDAHPAPGRQVALRFWPRGEGASARTLLLDAVHLTTTDGDKIAELDVGGFTDEGLHQWYVAEIAGLLRAVSHQLPGGAVVNERPEWYPSDWDETFENIPQIAIVPHGYTAPKCHGDEVLYLNVAVGQSLETLADRIVAFVKRHAEQPIPVTSPTVTVNRQTGLDGSEYFTVINHSNCPGRVMLRLAAPEVLLTSDFIGRKVALFSEGRRLRVELEPYAAMVLRGRAINPEGRRLSTSGGAVSPLG